MVFWEANNHPDGIDNINNNINDWYKPINSEWNEIFERFNRETSWKVTNIVTSWVWNATFLWTFSPYKNPLFE